MSDKVPDNLKPHVFKPGQSGNESGRPKDALSVRAIKKYTKEQLAETMMKYAFLDDFKELKRILETEKIPPLEAAILKIWAEAIKRGDEKKLDYLLQRMGMPALKSTVALEGGDDDKPLKMQVSAVDWADRAKQLRGDVEE